MFFPMVPAEGIGPSSWSYENLALPLSYAGDEKILTILFHFSKLTSLVYEVEFLLAGPAFDLRLSL